MLRPLKKAEKKEKIRGLGMWKTGVERGVKIGEFWCFFAGWTVVCKPFPNRFRGERCAMLKKMKISFIKYVLMFLEDGKRCFEGCSG